MDVTRRRLLGFGATLVSVTMLPGPAAARRHAGAWPDGHAGAVSLTYDDGLASQLDAAAPALEGYGLRGTFFVTASNIASRLADWRTLAYRGHEVVDHTIDHPCDLGRFAPGDFMRREIDPMERRLDAMLGTTRPHLYAYPCDVTNLGSGTPNRQASRYAALLRSQGIAAARTSEGAPNNPRRVARTRYRLQALAVSYDTNGPEAINAYLDLAATRGHWAILVFHEIVEQARAKGDTSIAAHRQCIEAIRQRNLWCAPMGKILSHIGIANG